MNKYCVICGTEFVATGNTITCSRECSLANRAEHNRQYMRAYYRRPDVKQRIKVYQYNHYRTPDVQSKQVEYNRRKRARRFKRVLTVE